jgi:hypothetical protein
MERKFKVYDPEFQNDTVLTTQEGELVKLKGYSKFEFIAIKLDNTWNIYEKTTGKRLSDGDKALHLAKKQARDYLNQHTDKNPEILRNQIAKFPRLNR